MSICAGISCGRFTVGTVPRPSGTTTSHSVVEKVCIFGADPAYKYCKAAVDLATSENARAPLALLTRSRHKQGFLSKEDATYYGTLICWSHCLRVRSASSV